MMIDAHAHLCPNDFGNVELYANQLKEAGIGQGIAVPGGMLDVRKLTEYVIGKSKPSKTPPNNDYVKKSFEENPAVLTGFACVNPHKQDAVEELENAFKNGFRGLKLSPMSHEFSFASKTVSALAALCGDYGFPFYTHTVFSPGASTARLVKLAKEFPQTNFIAGHMGFGPADTEALEGAQMDNFYLETSVGNFLNIKKAINTAGADKVIFGSEFPLSHPKVELEKVLLLNLSDDKNEKILGRNIKNLTKI